MSKHVYTASRHRLALSDIQMIGLTTPECFVLYICKEDDLSCGVSVMTDLVSAVEPGSIPYVAPWKCMTLTPRQDAVELVAKVVAIKYVALAICGCNTTNLTWAQHHT